MLVRTLRDDRGHNCTFQNASVTAALLPRIPYASRANSAERVFHASAVTFTVLAAASSARLSVSLHAGRTPFISCTPAEHGCKESSRRVANEHTREKSNRESRFVFRLFHLVVPGLARLGCTARRE
ncbi:hypothetical protein MRX96_028767 [Rhipicephalus microplus]